MHVPPGIDRPYMVPFPEVPRISILHSNRQNVAEGMLRFHTNTVSMTTLTKQAISSKDAASLDKDLMEIGGWSLDQLMELAGLSVSQASKHPRRSYYTYADR